MALEAIAKKNLNFYAPNFEVDINGKTLPINISKEVMNVSITEKLDEGASFNFTMNDEFDVSKQQFKWLDDPLFVEGNTVTIKIGYGNNLISMIEGKINALDSSFFSGGPTTLDIRGQDLSFDYLKRKSKERTFLNKSYSEIAKLVANEASLDAVVDDTPKFETVIHKDSNKTYFDFLLDLQKKSDREFSVNRKTIYFIKPKDDSKEIITLMLGKDIISFRPTINTTKIVTEVEVRGHNPRDPSSPIIGRAIAGSERIQEPGRKTASQIAEKNIKDGKMVITNVAVSSVEQANAIAKSELNKASNSLVEGEVESIGLPDIRPGVNIGLGGMGKRFSGKYYVEETTHTIDDNGYRTRFKVKRNAI